MRDAARTLVIGLLALMAAQMAALAAGAQEVRHALLIGNEAYPDVVGRLTLPHEDVDRIAGALQQAGFAPENITVLKDATQIQTNLAVAEFSRRLAASEGHGVGFFYYSGHGGSAEASGVRQNYLIPVGVPVTSASELPILGVPVSGIVDSLAAANAKAVFVVSDACRTTLPIASTKGGEMDKGMVRVQSRSGLYIAFATADGATAPDDGLFSRALATQLIRPGQTADRAFTLALREVASQRQGNRLPFSVDGLRGDICFAGCANDAAELAALGLAMAEPGTQALSEFLETYPETERRAHVEKEIYRRANPEVITVTGTRRWEPDGEISRPATTLVATLSGHEDYLVNAAFNADHSFVVSSSEDGTARVWNVKSGRQPVVLTGHDGPLLWAGFSPDGTQVVTSGEDDTIRLWDARTGRLLRSLPSPDIWVLSAAFSPDGKLLVTAGEDKSARVWDTASGKLVRELSGHKSDILGVAFSPDGTRIATASADESAQLWDVASGRMVKSLWGHDGELTSVAFSRDGRKLVTTSDDGTARVWDPLSGQPVAVLTGHASSVSSAEFSRDGTRILTRNWRTLRIWDAASGQLLRTDGGDGGEILAASFGAKDGQVDIVTGGPTMKVLELEFTGD